MSPLVSTPATEQWVDVSPDGRWLAYTSDLSGQTEVFVRAVSGGDQVQVSLSGGTEPMWSRNGRELFYRAAANAHTMMTSVTFNVGTVLAVASRTALFQVDDYDPSQPHSNFDVSPDGQNFVMVRRGPVSRIVVIQNLPGLVKKLQGTAVTR
jgi:Tol biopolymer transport system component